jgi:hypothetical protein
VRSTAFVLSWVVGLLVATPVYAETPLDDAIKSLKDSPVYVVRGIEGTTSETANELSDRLNGGDNILLVMLPAGSGDPSVLASSIDDATGRKHIVGVSVGDQLGATSAIMPSGKAVDLMQRAKSVSTSTVESLGTFIRNVHSWQVQHPKERASKPTTKKKDGGSSWILFVIAGIIAILLGVLMWARKLNRDSEAADDFKFRSSPDDVRDLLKVIMGLRPQIRDDELVTTIETACNDTNQYFRRSSDPKMRDEDITVFSRHLKSVRSVLTQYIDIQNNGRYYDNPDELIQQGRDAIAGFATFVEQSIRRGRRSELTEFKVDTDILSAQRYS